MDTSGSLIEAPPASDVTESIGSGNLSWDQGTAQLEREAGCHEYNTAEGGSIELYTDSWEGHTGQPPDWCQEDEHVRVMIADHVDACMTDLNLQGTYAIDATDALERKAGGIDAFLSRHERRAELMLPNNGIFVPTPQPASMSGDVQQAPTEDEPAPIESDQARDEEGVSESTSAPNKSGGSMGHIPTGRRPPARSEDTSVDGDAPDNGVLWNRIRGANSLAGVLPIQFCPFPAIAFISLFCIFGQELANDDTYQTLVQECCQRTIQR
jgi:hypothetical protein